MPSRWQNGPAALLLLLVLATVPVPSSAQVADLTAHIKRYGDFWAAGNYGAALKEAQNFASAARTRYGAQHESYAGALFLQAKVHYVEGRYGEAEKLYKQALAIFEKGGSRRDLARTLNGLGAVYEHQANYAAAEEILKRALGMLEKAPDSDQAVVAESLENLGNVYMGQGHYSQAEELYQRTLAIREQAPGGDRSAVTQTLNLLANLHMRFGRFGAAEPLLIRAIDLQENIFGRDHPDVAKSVNNLAELYRQMGLYAKAEPLQRRALEIQEKRIGKDHPHVGVSLNNLASLYWNWGRYADAEPLYRRALEIQEKALGGSHPQVATSLNNLGNVYLRLGRTAEAEPLMKRALAVREKTLPKDHPDIAQSLGNLAVIYRNSGRAAEGLPLLTRALAIMEKAYGADHLRVTYSLAAIANANVNLKRFGEAEPFAERALTIREKALGADHTDVASVLKTVAQVRLGTNRVSPAADVSRKSAGVAIRALSNGAAASLGFDVAALREYFDVHLAALYRAMAERATGQEAVAEAFEIAQWANQSAAAAASNQTAARVGAGNDALATLVRKQQDDLAEYRSLDKSLLAEASKPSEQRDPAREDAMRQRLKALDAQLQQSNTRISVEFPQYQDMISPKPLRLAEVQSLLEPGEALVLFHVSDQGNYVWAVTPERVEWRDIRLSRAALDEQVQKLRASLDISKLKADAHLFDLDVAHSLYSEILGPVESVLAGKQHLIVVSSGALTSLPLHILVTNKPSGKPTMRDLSAYRSAEWLMRRHAVTTLPSVSSLKTHRSVDPTAPQSYMGFGDPIFSSPQGPSGVRSRSAGPTSVSYRRHFRDGRVDLGSLNALPALSETSGELRSVAQMLGAPQTAVKLGKDATERAVKTAKLDNYRILHFATHALVAGETARYSDIAEPALVFTPPHTPSELDDGLLTSSEVALLKLNADWVILSACNTADGDKPGAEALSGLARAFFYAGAKTLLVSHWPLDSDAGAQLTTRMVQRIDQEKKMLPAEALRRAMLEYVDGPNTTNTYPGVWGPLMIVGLNQRPAK